MRGYKGHDAAGRLIFARTQDEARPLGPAELVEIPTDHKGVIAFLNQVLEWERTERAAGLPRGPVPESRSAPPAAPTPSQDDDHYKSPFSAATTIQRIDAQMCAAAVRQMDHPKALSTVIEAVVERFETMKRRLAA